MKRSIRAIKWSVVAECNRIFTFANIAKIICGSEKQGRRRCRSYYIHFIGSRRRSIVEKIYAIQFVEVINILVLLEVSTISSSKTFMFFTIRIIKFLQCVIFVPNDNFNEFTILFDIEENLADIKSIRNQLMINSIAFKISVGDNLKCILHKIHPGEGRWNRSNLMSVRCSYRIWNFVYSCTADFYGIIPVAECIGCACM